jgi:DNA-binding MarR family transcriptional regulator
MQSTHNPRELSLLNYIAQHAEATQRELSQEVGMSLGAINLLVKKFIKKGLVKVERLQPNSVKYLLTPAGIADKIERTYHYMARSFAEVNHMRNRIVLVANALAQSSDADHLCFFGPHDELHEVIHDLVRSDSFVIPAAVYSTTEQLKQQLSHPSNTPVLIWNPEVEPQLQKLGVEWVNVMGLV